MEHDFENALGHQSTRFHDRLKELMDEYVHHIYTITRNFPLDELYGVTSQLRRAALSVVLNYIEGFARQRDKVYRNFLEISYASLKESRYLIDFSLREGFLKNDDNKKLIDLADEIGAMLWSVTKELT